jgi:NTP pyrophosphatase (non-canonical NTP hydrolase)
MLNKARCQYIDQHIPEGAFTPVELCLALCGEAGELANLFKKVRRGDFTLSDARQQILNEIADIITYADLLCTSLHADTGTVVLDKFEQVSHRWGYQPPITMGEGDTQTSGAH